MNVRVSFHGATETVTGSRYLLESGEQRILVDCGLFQGYKTLRLRNWERPAFDPAALACVLLTHAHLDHSGWLPRLHGLGFRGPVYCTESTRALCRILLLDAARLQEEDARYANEHGFSRHSPALPLFTVEDAEAVLTQFRTVKFGETFDLPGGGTAMLSPAGHLLGAASIRVALEGTRILFSGDVGRGGDPIMLPPEPPVEADYLVIESTYGDRSHPVAPSDEELAVLVRKVCKRGGVLLIPSFAVGRAQVLLLLLARLMRTGRIPDVPVYLDSPMAIDATQLYLSRRNEHRLVEEECAAIRDLAHLVRTAEESRQLGRRNGPMIIIAGSGMATGGRILHHLKSFAFDSRNAILLAGYQAGGTRGAKLAAGERSVWIHGQEVDVRAEVQQLESLSAHADANELVAWVQRAPHRPRRIFVTHGEAAAADTFRATLARRLGCEVTVPRFGDCFELAPSVPADRAAAPTA